VGVLFSFSKQGCSVRPPAKAAKEIQIYCANNHQRTVRREHFNAIAHKFLALFSFRAFGYRHRGSVMADPERRWQANNARYLSTLVYLDEPQIVLLDHGDDAKIIGVAIDKDRFELPFLGAEISSDQWERYRRQFVDLRYLFLLPRWKRWYIFDLADEGEDHQIPLQLADKNEYRNEEYLPSHGFFARDHTEPEPEFGSADLGSKKFLIDGTWEPSDLSQFFGRINDLYSFFLGIRKFVSENTSSIQKRALIRAFTENTLHSGFNYVNFYGDLKGLLSFDERLAMGSIVKNSPGYVNIDGIASILDEVNAGLATYEENQESLRAIYKKLRNYLSRMKLLRINPEVADLTEATSTYIAEYNQRFATALGLQLGSIQTLSGSVLLTAKILLSYYRRVERYQLFFAEGRVETEA
jgi:hypothetical protein